MRNAIIYAILAGVIPLFSLSQGFQSSVNFDDINSSKKWALRFEDSGTDSWKELWFLDGEEASVTNSSEGMHLKAGPEQGNDAHHAVLWTKMSFEGNIKMEYEYTKTDTINRNVNILYIQATGIGTPPFEEDIYEWKTLRKVPKMSSYFRNMNAYHISYAAISNKGGYAYVRARRYPVSIKRSFQETVIEPSYDNEEDTFKSGMTYRVTVIKTDNNLFFRVLGDGKAKLFSWKISKWEPIEEGRIGFRHMFTRSARYKNIKIYGLEKQ